MTMASVVARSERGFWVGLCLLAPLGVSEAGLRHHGVGGGCVATVDPIDEARASSIPPGSRHRHRQARIEASLQSWRGGVCGSSLRAGGKRLGRFCDKGSKRGTDKGSMREGDEDSVGRTGTGLRRIGDEGSMRGANKGLVGQGR